MKNVFSSYADPHLYCRLTWKYAEWFISYSLQINCIVGGFGMYAECLAVMQISICIVDWFENDADVAAVNLYCRWTWYWCRFFADVFEKLYRIVYQLCRSPICIVDWLGNMQNVSTDMQISICIVDWFGKYADLDLYCRWTWYWCRFFAVVLIVDWLSDAEWFRCYADFFHLYCRLRNYAELFISYADLYLYCRLTWKWCRCCSSYAEVNFYCESWSDAECIGSYANVKLYCR